MKNKISKRVISLILSIVMLISLIPIGMVRTDAATVTTGGQTVDPHTLDGWMAFFGAQENHGNNVALTTEYAGGVWTDKSVFDPANIPGQLSGAKYNGNGISVADEGDNFLVALSAIASNKQVMGYSTRPTDTMLVLDLSGSMEGSVSAMVTAANEAMGDLLKLNNYNRVGVVLYSGNSNFGDSAESTATVLMPLARYTTTTVTQGVSQYIQCDKNERVSVAAGVSPKDGLGNAKNTVGATYTQNGIYKAMEQLVAAPDKVIPDGAIQAGTTRLPIVVLMSDGEPSVATTNYTDVGKSNVGDGDSGTGLSHDMAFLTQLTMAYAKREIDTAYGTESLMYTLGYSVDSNNYARSVLAPEQYTTTQIEKLWTTFKTTGSNKTFSLSSSNRRVTKHTDPQNKYAAALEDYRYYTDQYFPAAKAGDLDVAFQSIVNEIVLQAKYYPTYVENDHDHDGYLTFVDKIGSYMEVSDVEGIVVGDRLFSGAALAAKFVDGSFGTMEKPTATGSALIDSIMIRLGIDNSATAKALAVNAYSHGQLSYTDDGNFSHYLGWFSDANGNYVDFWHEGMTDAQIAEVAAKKNATHVVKSYLFLGDTSVIPGVNNTDMMYMSVRVATDISTMQTIVTWRIPASLVPTITYEVAVEVDNNGSVTRLVGLSLEDGHVGEPIRLLYEVGLRSDITDWNMTEKVSADYVSANGYTFYSNKWSSDPDDYQYNTYSHFEPSVQNERYYFTEDTTVLVKNGESYTPHTGAKPTGGSYYRSFPVYEKLENGSLRIHTHYEPITAEAMETVKQEGSVWVIPMGTVHRYYDYEITDKRENPTGTMAYSDHPFVAKSGSTYYTYSTHGNNGKFTTAPATGIRLTKNLAEGFETDETFTFVITGSIGSAKVVRLNEDGTEKSRSPLADSGEVTLAAGETVYIVGLTAGAYTVSEKIAPDAPYHVQSVLVNGQTAGTSAQLTLAEQTITSVEFVNAKQGYGSLVVSKDVNYPQGFTPTEAHNSKSFTVDVTFTGDISSMTAPEGVAVNGSIYTLTLKGGESATFGKIKHGVTYTVSERDNPAGYSLTEVRYSNESKTIQSAVTDEAHVVNAYTLTPATVPLKVVGTKTVTGGWPENASYTLRVLEAVDGVNTDTGLTATVTAGSAAYEIDLSAVEFAKEGVYTFLIVEDIPENRIADMAYDRSFGQFSVTVEDADADGKLEIAKVEGYQNTQLTEGENGYTVTKNFTNVVTKDIVYLDVQKKVQDAAGNSYTGHLADITFGLFASTGSSEPSYYVLTDGQGKARFAVPVSQDSLGSSGKVFYLREIAPAVENRVLGMRYDESWIAAISIGWDSTNNVATVEYAPVENGSAGTDWALYTEGQTVFEHTNTYEPHVYATPALVFSGTKTLNGGTDMGGREFSFSMYKTTAAFVVQGEALQTVKNNGNAITFKGVSFDTPGLHYLSVKEDATDLGGITLDGRHYHITVLVEKYAANDGTTSLRVAEGYPHIAAYGETGDVAADGLNFNNLYTVSGDTQAVIEGTKTLSGRPMLASEFTFRLEEVADENGTALDNALVLTAENGPANGSAKFAFVPITYSEVGAHYYKITEVAGPSGNGVTYSKDSFVVKVVVSDNGNGGLKTEQSVVGGRTLAFANTYKPSETYADMSAAKELSGKILIDGQFEFLLTETTGDFVTPLKDGLNKTVKNNGKGAIDFGRIVYTEAGTHYYVIREKIPQEQEPGITYDETVYHVIVRVVDDGLGALKQYTTLESVVTEGEQTVIEPVKSIIFYNRYEITGTAGVRIEGEKTLTGRELKDGEFTFELYATDENYTVDGDATATATNENGGFAFVLNYDPDAVGQTFHYVVREQNGGKTIDGVTYSSKEYRIRVKILDNGKGGLETAVEADGLTQFVSGNATVLRGANFENSYAVADAEVVFTVKKTVTGHSSDPKGFTFGLYEGNSQTPLRTVTSDEDGVVAFDALTVTAAHAQAEPHVFYVKEILPAGAVGGVKDGWTYDTTAYKVELTVTEDGKGGLIASYTVDGTAVDGDSYQFAFVNSYKKPAVTPQTGDESNLTLWMAMLVVSSVSLAALILWDRKRRKA